MDKVKSNSEPETLDAPSTFGGRRPSSGYAEIHAELWAAGHLPMYRQVEEGMAMGLRYCNEYDREMIVWAVVPIDSDQQAKFAAALIAERDRLHVSIPHNDQNQGPRTTKL